MAGPLEGLRVVELASEWAAYSGKLVADLGADVVLVEPPEGHHTRRFEPFVDDSPDPESSLWFWHYNANKLGVTLDLHDPDGRRRFESLLDSADVLVEAEPPGRLASIGLGYEDLHSSHSSLVMVSITPFGSSGPRRDEQATDLTLLAGGGPVWSCGYDDHQLPPVRGGGNQACHIAGHFAVVGLLVAVLARQSGAPGQHVDVNMHAAANVTTEYASYSWLAAQLTLERQTGRHASNVPTQPTQVTCGDGRYLNTGMPPRRPGEFAALKRWLGELGLLEEFPLAPLLEMGIKLDTISLDQIAEDPLIGEIFAAGRDAVTLIASKLPAYDAFVGFQQRGIPVGAVLAPEEVIVDPHIVSRQFPVSVMDQRLGRPVTYPGAPYKFSRTEWSLRRPAPRLGEHNKTVLHRSSD
jgi:crotonobetainyl-CoA:carnitine CoA-transferase CaiB-like acyl-CoA transferase